MNASCATSDIAPLQAPGRLSPDAWRAAHVRREGWTSVAPGIPESRQAVR